MSLEIESSDVIRLIQQFLKENNLINTLNALQEETGITLNIVDNIDNFVSDVHDGHWDVVLQALQHLKIPNRVLMELYEQIVIELVEMREISAARSLLRQTDPMDLLKQVLPERYLRLENLLSKTYFDPKEVYGEGCSKERKRKDIANLLSSEVHAVSPSRLLALLGQALKWQQLQGILPPGTTIDLFRGKAAIRDIAEETFPKVQGICIKFAASTFPQVVVFSPDGQYLVSGSSDGFVEVWNYMTGKLRKDLRYQSQDNFMLMENPITSLAFSKDSELLASGSSAGKLKVWKITTGQCVQRFEAAHSQSIKAILFNKDASQILTASADTLIRLHSLKSGKILKEFRGHNSYVNSICYTSDSSHIVSASSDGTIKIWSIKSCECTNTLQGNLGSAEVNLAMNCAIVMPHNSENIVVSNRSNNIFMMNRHGQVVKSYNNGRRDDDGDFVLCTVSPQGNWVYAVSQDHTLYCLNLATGKYDHYLKIHDKEVFSIFHHPFQNLIVTCSMEGLIKLWKP